jgi:hypothetical protein
MVYKREHHIQTTREDFINHWKVYFPDKPLPRITCDECASFTDGDCYWAYDLYNTHGDCLAVK